MEIALATILLVSTTLMVRSLEQIWSIDPGFQPNGVLSVDVNLPPKAYRDLPRAERTLEAMTERIRELPGVQSASTAEFIPFGGNSTNRSFWITDQPEPLPGDVPWARTSGVTAGYFATLRIPLLAGRDFSTADDERSPRVVIINEIFAQRHWPNQSPLGLHIRIGKRDTGPVEIVGVVKPVQMFLENVPERQMYLPLRQRPV